ncbi:MAG: response regulator [Candidatus Aminicenantales bacterium]
MKKIVVVVDDDASIRKTFFLILNRDYRVYLAGSAEEALQRFKHKPVDLIISDLKLPDRNGLEMISEFRHTGYMGEVICVSSFPELASPVDLQRLNIKHLFAKPLDLDALHHAIEALLEPPESLSNPLLP